MIGMFDPVVMDACRTKPCTGLLSGDDLSIPGGVKPGRERGKDCHILPCLWCQNGFKVCNGDQTSSITVRPCK